MSSSSERLERAAIDLAWSQWTKAGVSGWERGSAFNIDPEPLILLTAALGDTDPRLRDESTDWCIRYSRYISTSRLRNLLKASSEETRSSFGEYAATVNAHARTRWPLATNARDYEPTHRSVSDFTRPALLSLRLRALFGVGARAEIIRVFLSRRDQSWIAAAEMADEVSFSKRNVAEELEALMMGGILIRTRVRKRDLYMLARDVPLDRVIGPGAANSLRWPELVRVLLGWLDLLERLSPMDPRVQFVETDGFIRWHADDLRRVGLTPPDADSVRTVEEWMVTAFERIADGELPAAASIAR